MCVKSVGSTNLLRSDLAVMRERVSFSSVQLSRLFIKHPAMDSSPPRKYLKARVSLNNARRKNGTASFVASVPDERRSGKPPSGAGTMHFWEKLWFKIILLEEQVTGSFRQHFFKKQTDSSSKSRQVTRQVFWETCFRQESKTVTGFLALNVDRSTCLRSCLESCLCLKNLFCFFVWNSALKISVQ